VEIIVNQCRKNQDYILVLGIAIDLRRIDFFESLINLMKDDKKDLSFMITTAVHHARYNIHDIIFRDKFLTVIEE